MQSAVCDFATAFVSYLADYDGCTVCASGLSSLTKTIKHTDYMSNDCLVPVVSNISFAHYIYMLNNFQLACAILAFNLT